MSDEHNPCADVDLIVQELEKAKAHGLLLEAEADCIQNVFENYYIKNLLNAHDLLDKTIESGQRRDYITTCVDVMRALESLGAECDEKCSELLQILNDPYFRCLIEAHDNIVYETYKMVPSLPASDAYPKSYTISPPIRVVGLTKNPNEVLGITLGKHPDDCIYIQRILRGTTIEKQGLLNVGDIIKEINGHEVGKDPEKVQEELQSCQGSVTLKVIPAFKDSRGTCQVFLRCRFDYTPENDNLFPKNELGLFFQQGDILEIVDQSEPDWWQASHLDDHGKTGLIPSLKFEQSRQASVPSHHKESKVLGLFSKNKKKIMYKTSKNAVFDCLDVRLYEEVTKMPPMERKVIILIGAQGVGRRTLKNRLMQNYPDRYTSPIPDTSREPREGEGSGLGYNFLQRDEMENDIVTGKYLEWGEHNGHFYGTKLNSIRDIINAGKICLIDSNPSALKLLKTAEFMPLIVFIEAPKLEVLVKMNQKESGAKKCTPEQLKETVRESNEINEMYKHYFDLRICNDDIDKTYNTLREHIDNQSTEAQWVPINWVY